MTRKLFIFFLLLLASFQLAVCQTESAADQSYVMRFERLRQSRRQEAQILTIPTAVEHYCIINNPWGYLSGMYVDSSSVTYVRSNIKSLNVQSASEDSSVTVAKYPIVVSTAFSKALQELFDEVIMSSASEDNVLVADAPSHTVLGKNGITTTVQGVGSDRSRCEKFINLLYRFIAIAERRSDKSIEETLPEIMALMRDFRRVKISSRWVPDGIFDSDPKFLGEQSVGDAFCAWMHENVVYPEVLKELGISGGDVTVSFLVNTDGSVSDAEVMSCTHPLFAKEILRVIYESPKWEPATDFFTKQPVACTIELTFIFNEYRD